MAKQPVEVIRARMHGQVGGQKQVLREAKCPYREGFQKEGLILHSRNPNPSSILKTLTASL